MKQCIELILILVGVPSTLLFYAIIIPNIIHIFHLGLYWTIFPHTLLISLKYSVNIFGSINSSSRSFCLLFLKYRSFDSSESLTYTWIFICFIGVWTTDYCCNTVLIIWGHLQLPIFFLLQVLQSFANCSYNCCNYTVIWSLGLTNNFWYMWCVARFGTICTI